jgi:methionyl-tRNA formyltransferase|tara:strand:- start:429 stop:1112 length:684 start_codon:yes stop_codon:yes gene_type:complete
MSRIVVASIDNIWSRHFFNKLSHLLGPDKVKWVKDDGELSFVLDHKPTWVFFFHWSSKVSNIVFENNRCVVLHTSNLPEGRGGSPIQNQIREGVVSSKVNLIQMAEGFDTGGIYLSKEVTLQGNALDIWMMIADQGAELADKCVNENPNPKPQSVSIKPAFKRIKNNSILFDLPDILDVYREIQMVDAPGYPDAFVKIGKYTVQFSRPKLINDKEMICDARISCEEK